MLTENILFQGLDSRQIQEILYTTGYIEKSYQAGDIIMHQGDEVHHIGIVTSGSATGKKYTANGDEIIVQLLTQNKIFGDVLSGADGFASNSTASHRLQHTVHKL